MADSVGLSTGPTIVSKCSLDATCINPADNESAASNCATCDPSMESDDAFMDASISPSHSSSSSLHRSWPDKDSNASDGDVVKDDCEIYNDQVADNKNYNNQVNKKTLNKAGNEDKRNFLKRSINSPVDDRNLSKSLELDELNDGSLHRSESENNFDDLVHASSPGEFINNAFDYIKSRENITSHTVWSDRTKLFNDNLAEPQAKRGRNDFDSVSKVGRCRISDRKYTKVSTPANNIGDPEMFFPNTSVYPNLPEDSKDATASTEPNFSKGLSKDKLMIVNALRQALTQAFEMYSKEAALVALKTLEDNGVQLNGKTFQDLDISDNPYLPSQIPYDDKKSDKNKSGNRFSLKEGVSNTDKIIDNNSEKPLQRNSLSSSFVVEGEAKKLRTASQSQLCFGNVRVHSPFSGGGKDDVKTNPTKISNGNGNSLAHLRAWNEAKNVAMMAVLSPILRSKTNEEENRSIRFSPNKTMNENQPIALVKRKSDSPMSNSANSPATSPGSDQNPMLSPQNSSNKDEVLGIPVPINTGLVSSRSALPQNSMSTAYSSTNLSPESTFFKPYQSDVSNSTIYNGLFNQFGNNNGKILSKTMFQALAAGAAGGLIDKPSPFFPLPNHGDKSSNRIIPNLTDFTNLSGSRTPSYPSSTRNHFHQNSLAPFFSPAMQGVHGSNLASLYPGFHSHMPLPLASFPRPTGRHGLDFFDPLRMSSQSSRSSLSRDSRSTTGSANDFRDRSDSSPYSMAKIHEGLTPQHLKKAKLLFFYTRYPSANTLRIVFPDVNFDRAITSQLIKWFSNFREFFYIQMEKFARQALTDGIRDASHLKVTRECELLRVLNIHYNKCNEFKVPAQFMKVAESSLREFFLAIKAGKDKDPAWKKVIYKVICKLDFEIPEIFKSPNVLDRLHEVRD